MVDRGISRQDDRRRENVFYHEVGCVHGVLQERIL